MARQRAVIAAFNRGIVSSLGLARVEDIKRIALSASIMTNWMVRVLGAMMLRAGLGYISSTKDNGQAIQIPFVFSVDDQALLELTAAVMRVRIDDALVTRASVASAVTNGTFDTNLAGWNDDDESGGVSAWATGGYMSLVGTGTNAARRTQQITVGASDQNVEHALRIVVERGPVVLRVGSTNGGDEYITETTLGTGTHSLTLTPAGNFYIRLQNRRIPASLVDSVAVESAGALELPTPWAAADLRYVRWDDAQSGDVIFVSCKGYQQRKIERRTTRSWSIVLYEPEDGPFRIENTSTTTLTASAITGDITLTASLPIFRSTHAPSANSCGALFRLTSEGQRVESSIAADDTFTNEIRVTGVGESRRFTITITDLTGSGTTVTLQRSVGDVGNWEDVTAYTTDQSTTYADGLDNQVIFFRLGVKTGDYSAGPVVCSLAYPLGSITGVVRVTGYTSGTQVSARVLKDLGDTDATDVWAEGLWSDYRGWPTAGALYEGRMWWAGKDKINGTVSDAFESLDPDTEGDSGPINRSIGSGPVENIAWLLPLQRLIAGTEGSEVSCRSSALDEPLTPTAFNPKEATTQGSALVAAVKRDSAGIFVQRSGVRVYELAYDASVDANDYSLRDLTILCPEIGNPSIVKVAIQRQPDTRIHCIRSDGTAAVAVIDKAENVLCWLEIETDGVIEDVAVMPGTIEDRVYYTVQRTLGSGTEVRYLEKFALESECQGGDQNKQADAFVTYLGPATYTLTGLDHLEGLEVIVWGVVSGTPKDLSPDDADGVQTTYTVTGGAITLEEPVTQAVIGLPYDAPWKNAKLALAMATGSSLTRPRRIGEIGVILQNTHAKGLKYGRDFDNLNDLPQVVDGAAVDANAIHEAYDARPVSFGGEWSTDSRVCLLARAPRPCTIEAAVMTVEATD